MSFSSTPLGQGRRLDHHTFLNKPGVSKTRSRSPPRRNIPASYAYGAPSLGSRSPPKPDKTTTLPDLENSDDPDEPALVRFARIKQREQARTSSTAGVNVSSPHPEKWAVKDTSVNIAGAFNQAVTSADPMPPTNPNESWASGSRKPVLPRSTSVEYEKETQSTVNRRLAAPPSRNGNGAARSTRPPVSKSASIRHVSDSEGDDDRNGTQNSTSADNSRGKSPFQQVLEMSRNIPPVAYLMRRRSQEPEGLPSVNHNGNGNANTSGVPDQSSSYDYSAEERDYQAASAQKPTARHAGVSAGAAAANASAAHKRNRISVDNKAYRPTMSDLELSDEEFNDEDGKRTRKKKGKKAANGGPLTTLPVAGYDKKRRRKKGGKTNGAPGEDEKTRAVTRRIMSRSQRATSPVLHLPSLLRGPKPPSSRASASRNSVPPPGDSSIIDTSMDIEQALYAIPEEPASQSPHNTPSQPSFSIGASLGLGVNKLYHFAMASLQLVFSGIAMLTRLFGTVLGMTIEVLFNKPTRFVSHTDFTPFLKYAVVGLCIYAAWAALHNGWLPLSALPSWPSSGVYQAPSVPVENMGELSDRLQRLESALAKLSVDSERSDGTVKNLASEFTGRLGVLETRVQKESLRAIDAENQIKLPFSEGLQAVKQEVESLYAQIHKVQHEGEPRGPAGPVSDEDARAKLRALEERLGSVADEAKEALELGKIAVKAGASSGTGVAWWNKLASGNSAGSALTVKSTDGQDVTSLIRHLVHADVSLLSKDNLARPDFALHSAGARVVPALTSDTLEIQPSGLGSQIVGLITGGNGYAIGRPPVTALHHEIHNGHCWPFVGTKGQLGVALSTPAYITDVTIDHVPKEVATDMRSAPRQMELWGLVEGKDNVAKLKEWRAQRAARQEEARVEAELNGTPYVELLNEPPYPKSLPKVPEYVRVANFTYNIHAPEHVQTFPVVEEIRDLGIDFGLVVLLVKSNWGRDEFTCLYRLRVHGERIGEVPLPYPEDYAWEE
ncbi:hypothetical protein B0H21DRAFT_832778 [Amylocystis lapponica]|nr:hypothetical protein B0H21DRAFT_832778 [Amylocystis lapponica]